MRLAVVGALVRASAGTAAATAGRRSFGADVGADLAGCRRGVEQRAEGGSEPLARSSRAGRRRPGRLSAAPSRARRLVATKLRVAVRATARAPPPGSCAALSAGAGVGAGVDLALEHGHDQVRAPREVPVQRPDPDAGAVRRSPSRARPRRTCANTAFAASSSASMLRCASARRRRGARSSRSSVRRLARPWLSGTRSV